MPDSLLIDQPVIDQTVAQTTSAPSVPYDHAIGSWKPHTVKLRYSLSYLKLFDLKFPALRNPAPFDPAQPQIAHAQPPVGTVPRGYDLLSDHQLLSQEIPPIQRLPQLLCYAPRQVPHFYTDLRGGPGAAFQGMSAKSRSSIVRKVRQYKEFCGGEIRWETYRTPEELLSYHRLAREVAKKTYQERLFDSGIPDSEAFRNELAALAQRDAVRGFLLFHGDKPVAYLCTTAPDGFLVYDYLGYDPEYAGRSPGTVLQYLALQALYAEGRFTMYYWGDGHSQTKQIFSTGQVLGADIYYFRPTLRNRLAVYGHFASDRLAARAGALMEKLQLRGRIRKWLRKL